MRRWTSQNWWRRSEMNKRIFHFWVRRKWLTLWHLLAFWRLSFHFLSEKHFCNLFVRGCFCRVLYLFVSLICECWSTASLWTFFNIFRSYCSWSIVLIDAGPRRWYGLRFESSLSIYFQWQSVGWSVEAYEWQDAWWLDEWYFIWGILFFYVTLLYLKSIILKPAYCYF